MEVVRVTKKLVSCSGNKENSGHPKVYLRFGNTDEIICPYCNKKFLLKI